MLFVCVAGHLRRAVGFQGRRDYVEAQADLEFVLDREPENKGAQVCQLVLCKMCYIYEVS